MEKFAHEQNVQRFERELLHETDPERRAMLERLLAEERQHVERMRQERSRKPDGD